MNAWNFRGPQDVRLELAARRLRADLFEWFDRTGVPTSKRLSDVTCSMIGHKDKQQREAGLPHSGCAMKTKAAETDVVMQWAVDLVRRYPDIPLGDEVLAAGVALENWMELMRAEPWVLRPSAQQALADASVRHLLHAQRALIEMTPKHNFFAHSSNRLEWMGNPKRYSTFLDESPNLLPRTVTAAAHRVKQSWRVLHSFNLIGTLKLTPFIFGQPSE